jgi:hypothetical protein
LKVNAYMAAHFISEEELLTMAIQLKTTAGMALSR